MLQREFVSRWNVGLEVKKKQLLVVVQQDKTTLL